MSILPPDPHSNAARRLKSDEGSKTTGRVGHTTKYLLLLYNNDLFTVQTRDEQERRDHKSKTRSNCVNEHGVE